MTWRWFSTLGECFDRVFTRYRHFPFLLTDSCFLFPMILGVNGRDECIINGLLMVKKLDASVCLPDKVGKDHGIFLLELSDFPHGLETNRGLFAPQIGVPAVALDAWAIGDSPDIDRFIQEGLLKCSDGDSEHTEKRILSHAFLLSRYLARWTVRCRKDWRFRWMFTFEFKE